MESHPVHPVSADPVTLPPSWRRGLIALVAIGALLTLAGVLVEPQRTWSSLLLGAFFALCLGLGGLLFVAFAYVTKAGWSVAVRRVPEAMAATLPVGMACMLIALLGMPWLYEWSRPEAAHDHLLHEKAAWLNVPFFTARTIFYMVIWLGFAGLILRMSRRQDQKDDISFTRRNVVLSTVFLIVFAFTFSAASFDWIMSLEPHWFSTVFALYHITGMFLAALAAITVALIVLRRLGPFRNILHPEHLHDIGRLTIGFCMFWGYLWFSQHMLIWYSNIPEETAYYVGRQSGAWEPIFLLNVFVNWLVPFLALLSRPSKRSETVMLNVALLLLAGRWLDLYVGILPAAMPDPAFGIFEIGPVVAVLSLTVLAFFRAFRSAQPVPVHDPYLVESLHHHS